MKKNKIQNFIDRLGSQEVNPKIIFNQYHEDYNYPQFFTTKINLLFYLTQMYELQPKTILVGEAPGRNGCAVTGIPFTSVHVISKTNKFGLFGFQNIQENKELKKENTATMVWDVLEKLNFCPLLWNAYPFNPIDEKTKKNRKPTTLEIDFGIKYLKELIELYNISNFVAVGKTASSIFDKMKIEHYKVPHPSYGKKQKFHDELKNLLEGNKV